MKLRCIFVLLNNNLKKEIMTHEQILNNRLQNENLLLDYFKRVNVPVERLQKVEVCNGRNNLCSAFKLICKDDQEYNYHKSSFYYATDKGGDFFQNDPRFFVLVITIKDGWH